MTAVPTDGSALLAFLNTLDADAGTDELDSPASFARWLARQGLGRSEAVPSVGDDELRLARELRSVLRRFAAGHHDGTLGVETKRQLETVAQQLPLAVGCVDGRVTLVPATSCASPARHALASVLVTVASADAAGWWRRVKLCPADDCAWAFYDESRNRSRRWCAMEVCGNRAKTRSYRRRH